ncbi:SdpI family protein [Thermus filiformis]|uniref:SdpI family protein n=1 Tax=Thermus filiformis TaxID=276 RepID=UPI0009E4A48B|nr:SdpI family protein [Thermus filiformis]
MGTAGSGGGGSGGTIIIFIAVSIFFLAALLIGLSIPFLQDKVPPNGVYGFRTPKTLSDPAIWYEANRFAAKASIAVGIVMFVLGVVLLLLNRYTNLSLNTLVWLSVAFEFIPALVLLLVLLLYERRL